MDEPKGHYNYSMSDEEIKEKTLGVALKFIDDVQIIQITKTVFAIDDLENVGNLMRILVFDNNR